MKFHETTLPGLFVIEPKVFGDDRGFFVETYRKSAFLEQGIQDDFVQDNHSKSSRGILRGLHYQIAPATQAKIVRVVSGEIFDVAVDLRKDSQTFGRWYGEVLSGENKKAFYIPEGFAHGFLCLRDETHVVYKASAYYSPEHERGLHWNDPKVGIEWPVTGMAPVLVERDENFPPLKDADLG